ncbi:hypothetical protein U1Q18_031520 [Sarracenia purpurea var. burkii]
MEGLIPLVYRTLKKTKIRRQYKCLSTGAAQSYNITDFYAAEGYGSYSQHATPLPENTGAIGGVHAESTNGLHHRSNGHHHRRHKSISSGAEFSTPESMVKSKQIVRFHSNRFLSCVTGA